MLRRRLALFAFFFLTVPLAFAQFVPVSGTKIQDATGGLLQSGQVCFVPANNNGTPINFKAGGGGQVLPSKKCVPVTNGAFSTQLADSNLASPANVCYYTSVTIAGTYPQQSYVVSSCLQPSVTITAANSSWCTTSACNLDNYISSSTPGTLVTTGPAGQAPTIAVGTVTVGTTALDYGSTLTQTYADALTRQYLWNIKLPLAPSATDTTKLPLLGGTMAGPLNADGTILHASNPMLPTPGIAMFQAQVSQSLITGSPVNIVVLGDSIDCCIGSTDVGNSPIYKFAEQMHRFGNGGTGLVPILRQSGTFREGWSGTGVYAFTQDFGPYQLAPTAENTMMGFTAAWALNYVGASTQTRAVGDTVLVAGETTSSTTTCTLTVDGTTISTSIGGTSASPTPYLVSFPLPQSLLLTHPTHTLGLSGAAGSCILYGAGFVKSTGGIIVNNFSVPGIRADGYGLAVNTQLAYVAKLNPAPALAILETGTNDKVANSPTAYATYLQNTINYLLTLNPQMSILIEDANDGGIANSTMNKAQVQAVERTIAQTNGAAYVSVAENWTSIANATAQGLMFTDGVHPSDKGGISSGSIIFNAVMGSQQPSTFSVNPTILPTSLSVPVDYSLGNATQTSSGNTITLNSQPGKVFYFSSSASLTITGCADSTFDATSVTPTMLSASSFSYTVSATPGASTSGCVVHSNQYYLDLGRFNDHPVFTLALTSTSVPITSALLVNPAPGQTVTIEMGCAGGNCPSAVWPSSFTNPPPSPTFNGSFSTAATSYDYNLHSAPPFTILRGTSGALTAGPIAAGACTAMTALFASTTQNQYVGTPTMTIDVTPQANPGTGLEWNNGYLDSTNPSEVHFNVCNHTSAAITASAVAFNVSAH